MKDLGPSSGKNQRLIDLFEEIADYTEILANESMTEKSREKMTKRVQKLSDEKVKLQEDLQPQQNA